MNTTTTMTLDDLDRILKRYTPREVSGFALSGGESLLHPQFVEVVELIRDRFRAQEIALYTNGIALVDDRDLLENLCRSSIDRIQFSLHGATQQVVSVLQPGVDLESTLGVINYVGAHSRIRVAVNYVIQEANVGDMLQFVELLASSAAEAVFLTPMNFAGHRTDAFDYREYWQSLGLQQRWRTAAARATELGLLSPVFRDLCACPDNVDVLTADGSMLLCWGNYLAKKYSVGNVLHEDPASIRQRREFKLLQLARRRGSKPEMCRACWLWGYELQSLF